MWPEDLLCGYGSYLSFEREEQILPRYARIRMAERLAGNRLTQNQHPSDGSSERETASYGQGGEPLPTTEAT